MSGAMRFLEDRGIGAAAFRYGDLEAGAVAAVNCVGDIVKDGVIIAGALGDDLRSFVDSRRVILEAYPSNRDFFSGAGGSGGNTVLGCLITNAAFDKAGAARPAGQGQDAIARLVRPATLFLTATRSLPCAPEPLKRP